MMGEFQRTPRKNIDMDEVVRLYAEGISLIQIAKRFGTTHTTIGDRLARLGVRIRGRREALQVLWRGHPAPRPQPPAVAGVTPQTKTYMKGSVAALRAAGLSERADELERDVARVNELAIKFGVVLHNPLSDAQS